MRARSNKQGKANGFTLIELTIVLAVIVTLALILTPSIANIINDSKQARTYSDCNTLANAIVQFYKDTGFFPQWAHAKDGGRGDANDRLSLLVGPGNAPNSDMLNAAVQPWVATVTVRTTGTLSDQLLSNTPLYLLKGPQAEFGWNGPYLSSKIGTDPWNNRYMVNIGSADGTDPALNGVRGAVWVISAGPNGIIETPFSQPITAANVGGDDIGKRIQ